MAISGLGKTKMFELIAAGKVQTVKVGTRRLVRMDSLRELLTNVCTNVSSSTPASQSKPQRPPHARISRKINVIRTTAD